MKFNVISIFPNQFSAFLQEGVVGQAAKNSLISVNLINPRDFTLDAHKTVDDRPFGGGDGMVMLYEPLKKAIQSLGEKSGKVIYLSPQGKPLNQKMVECFAEQNSALTLICGRYAGVDSRFITEFVDEEISIGDYVLSGGEVPAMVLMDAISRQIPGVLGHVDSARLESFNQNLLEAPLFTRPRQIEGFAIPNVLLEGDHKKINEFRLALSVLATTIKRPDLLKNFEPEMPLEKASEILGKLSDLELRACGIQRDQLAKYFESDAGGL